MPYFTVAQLREDQIGLTFPLARLAGGAPDEKDWIAELADLRAKGGLIGLFANDALFGFLSWYEENSVLKVAHFLTCEVSSAAPGRKRLCEAADALARARRCEAVEIRIQNRGYAQAESAKAKGWHQLGHSLDAVIFRKELVA